MMKRTAMILGVVLALGSSALAEGPAFFVSKLLSPAGASGQNFGFAVAMEHDVAFFGAPGATSARGKVDIFRRAADGSWNHEQTLAPAGLASSDQFGYALDLDGDVAVIGAYGVDSPANNAGAAYVYRRVGGTWVQEQILQASDASALARFGIGVAIDGGTIVIGANGEQHAGFGTGAAYVFVHNGTSWVQQQKLVADDASSGDVYGRSVDVLGDRIVVGAALQDEIVQDSGAAYVYTREAGAWTQAARLKADNASFGDYFGFTVELDDRFVFVTAGFEGSVASSSGAVYVFEEDGGTWVQRQMIKSSDAATGDFFGYRVRRDGDLMLIGAPTANVNAMNSGAAYLFSYDVDAEEWVERVKLSAFDGDVEDDFGWGADISGGYVICGAYFDDDLGSSSGSAYVFDIYRLVFDPLTQDCNGNGIADYFDLFRYRTSADCNGNGIPDECDIASGYSLDVNQNGIPDECEPGGAFGPCAGDANGDGVVDVNDITFVVLRLGSPCP